MIDPIITMVAALTLSVIFASAASHKLMHRVWFRRQVQEYELIHPLFVPVAAIVLPIAELMIALGLLWSGSRVYAAVLALLIIATYAVAISINLIKGRKDIDCGCSGPTMQQPLQPGLLLRNAFLAVLAFVACIPLVDRLLGLHDNFVMILAATVLVLLYTAADLWLANRPASIKLLGEK